MGLFFDAVPRHDRVAAEIQTALMEPPPADAATAAAQAEQRASAALAEAPNRFQAGRFLGAFAIFALLVAGGVVTDGIHQAASSAALFAMGTTLLGVVVAFFGTEKSS